MRGVSPPPAAGRSTVQRRCTGRRYDDGVGTHRRVTARLEWSQGGRGEGGGRGAHPSRPQSTLSGALGEVRGGGDTPLPLHPATPFCTCPVSLPDRGCGACVWLHCVAARLAAPRFDGCTSQRLGSESAGGEGGGKGHKGGSGRGGGGAVNVGSATRPPPILCRINTVGPGTRRCVVGWRAGARPLEVGVVPYVCPHVGIRNGVLYRLQWRGGRGARTACRRDLRGGGAGEA